MLLIWMGVVLLFLCLMGFWLVICQIIVRIICGVVFVKCLLWCVCMNFVVSCLIVMVMGFVWMGIVSVLGIFGGVLVVVSWIVVFLIVVSMGCVQRLVVVVMLVGLGLIVVKSVFLVGMGWVVRGFVSVSIIVFVILRLVIVVFLE